MIIKLARDNDWGYTRIMGELKKLGIKPPSRNTVKNILKENGLEPIELEVKKAAHRSPNTVAFVERFIQTLQQECLDYFIVFGEQHMDHIVSEMVTHYHEQRPHQSKENEPLVQTASVAEPTKAKRKKKDEPSTDVIPVSQIDCRQRLGGLLKHYYRKAA